MTTEPTIQRVRKDFETATESYYEGDFATYADGEYVNPQQQDDFTMFRAGFKAAWQTRTPSPLTEAERHALLGEMNRAYRAESKRGETSGLPSFPMTAALAIAEKRLRNE